MGVVVQNVILMAIMAPWDTPKEVSEISSQHVAMEWTIYTRNKNLPHEPKLGDIKISKNYIYVKKKIQRVVTIHILCYKKITFWHIYFRLRFFSIVYFQ